METRRSVALALGSGGARGYAHIGAIQALEERGFEIVAIAGSSMGALVGGLYAAGVLDEYAAFVSTLSQLDVVRFLDVSLTAPGAIRATKVLAHVGDLLGGARIEDLEIAFTAVATDLGARREVWFQRGPVETAIRASIAIPGVITPVMLNGRLLADGGLMNPVPVAPTVAAHADLTIAISLAGPGSQPEAGSPTIETAESRPVDEWVERFRRSTSSLFDSDVVRSVTARFGTARDAEPDEAEASDPELFEPLPSELTKFDVMTRSLDAMQGVLSRYRLAGYPPDLLIDVPKDACRTLDFYRAKEMIALGRQLTLDALDRANLSGEEGPLDVVG